MSCAPVVQTEELDLEDGQWEDVHVITGALKLFFRELPEPLFPYSHFNRFITAISEHVFWIKFASFVQTISVVFGSVINIYKNFVFPGIPDYSTKLACIYELVKSLPPSNHDTMQLLFGHLRRYDLFFYLISSHSRQTIQQLPAPTWILNYCSSHNHHVFPLVDRVIQYGDDNRMTVQNVAIVFGPTLLRPEMESSNITMHMVFQNQIVEFILNEYERIFYFS